MQGIDLSEGFEYGVRLTLFGIFVIAMSGISTVFGVGLLADTLGYSVGVSFDLPLRGINTTLIAGFGVILTAIGVISFITGLVALVYKLIVDAVSRGAQMATTARSRSQSHESHSNTQSGQSSQPRPQPQPRSRSQSPQSRSPQQSNSRNTRDTDSETTPGRR
ncbi:MAG: hypothetical protein J07HQW1_03248 [Haloquadratum walsbyi J07HQW1]|jgi:hypothetical protein|uniref:Uncharacterized protein n=1 Tax=Haloquadratum walsbyi J07HQW1 TaxID=1238424 RepID=U1MSL5_9EURY|nr:MAG: hypothetical protein J07HQW1_03248 [Haloquadratum walsbyi J07HQW1]